VEYGEGAGLLWFGQLGLSLTGECRGHAGGFSSYRALGRLVRDSEESRPFSSGFQPLDLPGLLAGQGEFIGCSVSEAKGECHMLSSWGEAANGLCGADRDLEQCWMRRM